MRARSNCGLRYSVCEVLPYMLFGVLGVLLIVYDVLFLAGSIWDIPERAAGIYIIKLRARYSERLQLKQLDG